jgi:hypothetical protein
MNGTLRFTGRSNRTSSDQRDVVAAWADRLRSWIRWIAMRRARDNESMRPDLEQAAYLRLVEIDPSRLTLADERWLKRRLAYAIKCAAIDEMRHARPREDRWRADQVSAEDVLESIADAPRSTLEARRFRKNRRERLARRRAVTSQSAESV